jgi:hypothetical protein
VSEKTSRLQPAQNERVTKMINQLNETTPGAGFRRIITHGRFALLLATEVRLHESTEDFGARLTAQGSGGGKVGHSEALAAMSNLFPVAAK